MVLLHKTAASANSSLWFQEQTWASPVAQCAENLCSLLGLLSYICTTDTPYSHSLAYKGLPYAYLCKVNFEFANLSPDGPTEHCIWIRSTITHTTPYPPSVKEEEPGNTPMSRASVQDTILDFCCLHLLFSIRFPWLRLSDPWHLNTVVHWCPQNQLWYPCLNSRLISSFLLDVSTGCPMASQKHKLAHVMIYPLAPYLTPKTNPWDDLIFIPDPLLLCPHSHSSPTCHVGLFAASHR